MACLLISCGDEFTPTELENAWLIHKNGKVGMIPEGRIKFISKNPNGKSYGTLDISKELLTEPTIQYIGIIPWYYDDIVIESFGAKNKLFRCVKDGKNYYYTTHPSVCGDGNPVNKIEELGRLYCGYSCHHYSADFKFYTDQGVYTKSAGPHEDIYLGIWGYAFKENGKWGWISGRSDINKGQHTLILPAKYDGIIEVLDSAVPQKFGAHKSIAVVLARTGNVWQAFDTEGNQLPANQAYIESLFKIPAESQRTLDPTSMGLRQYQKRCGDRTNGLIVITR